MGSNVITTLGIKPLPQTRAKLSLVDSTLNGNLLGVDHL